MRYILVLCCFLMCAVPVSAVEIGGVQVTEKLEGAGGTELTLNGAGIRSKMFFKIYVAGLYLQNPTAEAEAALADPGQKQMLMHFLYDEVDKEKLVAAWNEGFEGNLSEEQLKAMAPQIKQFNEMFVTVKKGDVIVIDYIPMKGTSVIVAGEPKGVIEGKEFSDAVFAIWLGKKPVTEDLKKELLSLKK